MSKKIAVVTGGNRGLGFGVCQALAERGYHVILTARSLQKAKQACERLAAASLEVEAAVLDVASEQSVQQFFSFLMSKQAEETLRLLAEEWFQAMPDALRFHIVHLNYKDSVREMEEADNKIKMKKAFELWMGMEAIVDKHSYRIWIRK